ncbi:MAG: polysaccharide deacetylase family protein, partial [bacterium]
IRQRVSPISWVLVYHHIYPGLRNLPFLNVSPGDFEKQIKFLLTRNYKIISLSEMIEYFKEKGKPPSRAVVITFDDGFKNNYLYAYPILRKYNLPATIFLTTGFIKGGTKCVSFSPTWKKIFQEFPQSALPLSWDEVRVMGKNGIDFGAHTISHPHLLKLSYDEAREEIIQSKKEIEEKIGKEVKYFSYPYGEYNERIIEFVKEVGFTCVLSTNCSPFSKKTSIWEIGRIDGAGVLNFPYFGALLSGFVTDFKGLFRINRENRRK